MDTVFQSITSKSLGPVLHACLYNIAKFRCLSRAVPAVTLPWRNPGLLTSSLCTPKALGQPATLQKPERMFEQALHQHLLRWHGHQMLLALSAQDLCKLYAGCAHVL